MAGVLQHGRTIAFCSPFARGREDVITLDSARKKARTYLGHAADSEDPHAASVLGAHTITRIPEQVLDALVDNLILTGYISDIGQQDRASG
ncbi:MAG: hypothetical protein KDI32_09690 [Pseudomonadales bacterium]|nr:hypothetical protein [Pseudomonadales bacterium]